MSEQLHEPGTVTHYMKVEPAVLEMHPGQTAQLKAYLVWMDGREEEITERVRWSTEQPQIGTISKSGAVTVAVVGTMTVLAQYGEQRTETHIDVVATGPAKKKRSGGTRKSMIIGAALVAVTLTINGYALSQKGAEKGADREQPAPAASVPSPPPEGPSSAGESSGKGTSLFGLAKEKAVAAVEIASALKGEPGEHPPAPPAEPPAALPTEPPPVEPPLVEEPPAEPSPEPGPPVAAQTASPAAAKKEPPTRPKSASPKKNAASGKMEQPKSQASAAPQPPPKPAQPAPPPNKAAAQEPILQPVQKDGKWGYVKQINPFDKELAISYQFDHAAAFSEGLAVVKKGGKFGYINTQGALVIGFQYEYAAPFQGGTAKVKQDGKLITIDKTGAVVN